MDAPNTSEPSRQQQGDASSSRASASIAWAGGALILTAVVGALAKVFGVLITPGMRGIASQRAMELTDGLSATFSYTFAALLVALICGGSFELARIQKIGVLSRGGVVAISGLVVALASPAVMQRLHTMAALCLALVASVLAMIASASTLRVAHTRAVGALLALLALSGVLRPIAWEVTALAGERASLGLYHAGRTLATFTIAIQALAALLAAAWLGTRSRWRGRMLANAAVVIAFGITYIAARDGGDTPSALEAVLRGSLTQSSGLPTPYALGSIAAFLVPATILLALVAVVQRAQPPAVLAALALALLSQGAFDVPLGALAITPAGHWALLAMNDKRSMWMSMVAQREAASPPARPAAPAAD
jgi:hypothetical protein